MNQLYHKTNPLPVAIVERYNLCRGDARKATYHLSLDLGDAEFEYQVGDSIAVFGQNDGLLVDRLLEVTGLTGSEVVVHPKTGASWPLRGYLLEQASIANFGMPLLKWVGLEHPSVAALLERANREEIKAVVEAHEVWDLLEKYPLASVSAQALVDVLMPLLPRFYSIASSSKAGGKRLDLTVALTAYETSGIQRQGVCSGYLCQRAPLYERVVPIYLQPSPHFHLPADPEVAIIMIGPGTGVAPFRGFLQEREVLGSKGKNWLFFGEWTREYHYYYADYWESLVEKGLLRVELAFSREQSEKIYVQDKMREHAKELYRWLRAGAYIYVCGDAQRMAKDVDSEWVSIIERGRECSHEAAREYLKALRKEGRYLRDVY